MQARSWCLAFALIIFSNEHVIFISTNTKTMGLIQRAGVLRRHTCCRSSTLAFSPRSITFDMCVCPYFASRNYGNWSLASICYLSLISHGSVVCLRTCSWYLNGLPDAHYSTVADFGVARYRNWIICCLYMSCWRTTSWTVNSKVSVPIDWWWAHTSNHIWQARGWLSCSYCSTRRTLQ